MVILCGDPSWEQSEDSNNTTTTLVTKKLMAHDVIIVQSHESKDN